MNDEQNRPRTLSERGAYNTRRDSWTPEQEACFSTIERRATEVFGNNMDASIWWSGFDRRIGPYAIRDAIKTPEGMRAALEVLDELSKTVVPLERKISKRPMRRRR